jgi:hypothetical protein
MSMHNHLLHTFRVLRREPGYAGAAVLAIALGIGATTTLFSVAYGVLLKPLPWPYPDRLVRLQERRGGRPGRVPLTITNGTYLSWAESTSLEGRRCRPRRVGAAHSRAARDPSCGFSTAQRCRS